MPPKLLLKPREIIKRLEQLGFVHDHTSGSHAIYFHNNTKRRAVVPLHVKELPKGTVKALLRESGIETRDFLRG
ncbi:MAG: type II toxin-antitoxin system HicA family toxin [Patescibacteria group bacterium]